MLCAVKARLLFYCLCLSMSGLLTAPLLWAQAPSPTPTVARALKPEMYLLQVEPRVMGTSISKPLGESQRTVFTPSREVGGEQRMASYTVEDFNKLGISWESFVERARKAADKKLATLKPEIIKDAAGKVLYAVYRGDEPIYASLIVAPSLAKIFEAQFGKEIWLAAPDRNALYVFPAKPEVVVNFSADLEERYESNAYAASEEIFSLNEKGELKAVAQFTR